MSALLLLHAAATLAMTGLVWFVQLVHYPLFALASERRFERFAAEHQSRTSWVVIPLMVSEAVTAVALVVWPPPSLGLGPVALGLALVALVWGSTAVLQVPLHRRLAAGFDGAAVRRLVTSNWLRTAIWTARSGLVLWLLARAGG